VRVAARQPDDEVRRDAEQPDHGPGDHRQDVERAGDQQCPALGALHRDPLRRQLADDQRDERQRDGDQHDRGRSGAGAEEAQRPDQRLRQRHRGRGRREEAGQGDPDLDGGQEPVRVAGQPGQHPSAA
jgi:hypothetical protein